MAEEKNNDKRFEIVTRTGERYKLDKATVMKYLTDNKEITDSEFNMFFQLCKVNKVNPFLKEAYIIKYGLVVDAFGEVTAQGERHQRVATQYRGGAWVVE